MTGPVRPKPQGASQSQLSGSAPPSGDAPVEGQLTPQETEALKQQFSDMFAQPEMKEGVTSGTFDKLKVRYEDKFDQFLKENPAATAEEIQAKFEELFSGAQTVLSTEKGLWEQLNSNLEQAQKRKLEIIKG